MALPLPRISRPPKAPVHDVMLSVDQAAERLRLKPQTVRHWLCKGRIGCFRVGGRVSIPTSEIERILGEAWRPAVKLWGPNAW